MGEHGGKTWWNLGGWGNKRHAFELGGEACGETAGHIANNRWYDVVIDTSGGRLKCTLDGKLIHDITPPKYQTLFASATRDEATQEIIVKVVNAAPEAREAVVDLNGVTKATVTKALLLTSPNPMDENSLDEPRKVAPKPVTLTTEGGRVRHLLPGNSFLVFRLKP